MNNFVKKTWIDIWNNNEWITDFKYPSRMALTFYKYHISKNIELNTNFYIVDAGCGSLGNTLFFLENNLNVIGIDIVNKYNCLKNDRFKFINCSLDQINLEDNCVDSYFSDAVLYYGNITYFRNCCKELKRILKNNGIFRFSVKHISDYLFNKNENKFNINKDYVTEIVGKGWEKGLEITGFTENGLKNEVEKLFPDYEILIGHERFHYTTTNLSNEHYFLVVTGIPK